jgi:hypothetical protein
VKPAPLFLLLLSLAVAPCSFGQGESTAMIKARTKFLEGGMKSSTIVDPEQRTAVETLTDAKDRVLKKTTFMLDERNLAFAAIHYDGKGNIRYKETYQRDGAGNVVETKFTGADDKPLGRRVFNFHGNSVASIDDYDAQGKLMPKQTKIGPGKPDKKR